MVMDTISLANAIVLLLATVLVALSASVVLHSNKKFSEGEVKSLGRWVFFALITLLGKLLTDFSIQALPFFWQDPSPLIQLAGIFGIVFIVLTAIFLIQVALMIRVLSKTFGFEIK